MCIKSLLTGKNYILHATQNASFPHVIDILEIPIYSLKANAIITEPPNY